MWWNQNFATSEDSGLNFGGKCYCMMRRQSPWAFETQMMMTSSFTRNLSLCPTRCGLNCDITMPKYQYPLSFIRPDQFSYSYPIKPKPSQADFSFSRFNSPQIVSCDDREKFPGYTGNRFFTYPQFGHTSKIESTSALCDYTNKYQFTKAMEFTPLPFYHASLHGERPASEIYPRNTGLVPSYKGHVPGMQHSYGKTFGHESINAKRYLSNSSICMH